MLANETKQVGELRLHRVLFAALAETDDPEIHRAIKGMYRRYQKELASAISAHRATEDISTPSPDHAAWAAIGLVTVINIARELNLISRRELKQLFVDVAGHLLDAKQRSDR